MTQPIHSNIETLTEGIVAACRRADGRWLFIRRSATVRRPLRVCFQAGGLRLATAGRGRSWEMREELNVDVVPVRWSGSTGLVSPAAQGWLAELTSATPSKNPTEVHEISG
jgi:hypothetical protein